MQPRGPQVRGGSRHPANRIRGHEHRVGFADAPALARELVDDKGAYFDVRADKQQVVQPAADETADRAAALRPQAPDVRQHRVGVALLGSARQLKRRRRNALVGEKRRHIGRDVLLLNRVRDPPEDEVADLAAVVVRDIRERLKDHTSLRAVSASRRQGDFPDLLQVVARVGRLHVVGQAELDKTGLVGEVEFVDEARQPLRVDPLVSGHFLRQFVATGRSRTRPAGPTTLVPRPGP